MKSFRKTDHLLSLSSGPGKLTQAMNIRPFLNGADMTDPKSRLHIEEGYGMDSYTIVKTKRIGISQALDKYWRFVIADEKKKGYLNKYASRRKYDLTLTTTRID
jgi:DNA-3-methyladenine glycosylase